MKTGAYFSVRVLIHELKQARIAAGLTLATVAERCGIDEATLSRLENGKQRNPTIDTLWRYADGLGRRLIVAAERGDS
jgi:transcriptional regulator with XRE-family HTH domain